MQEIVSMRDWTSACSNLSPGYFTLHERNDYANVPMYVNHVIR